MDASFLWLLSYKQQSLAHSNMRDLLWSHVEYEIVFFIIVDCPLLILLLTSLLSLNRPEANNMLKLSTRLYGKRDDFDFHVVSFLFQQHTIWSFLWCIHYASHKICTMLPTL